MKNFITKLLVELGYLTYAIIAVTACAYGHDMFYNNTNLVVNLMGAIVGVTGLYLIYKWILKDIEMLLTSFEIKSNPNKTEDVEIKKED